MLSSTGVASKELANFWEDAMMNAWQLLIFALRRISEIRGRGLDPARAGACCCSVATTWRIDQLRNFWGTIPSGSKQRLAIKEWLVQRYAEPAIAKLSGQWSAKSSAIAARDQFSDYLRETESELNTNPRALDKYCFAADDGKNLRDIPAGVEPPQMV